MTQCAIVADDHELVRAAIRGLIEEAVGLCVAAEADQGIKAIGLIRRHKPVVAVVDVALPLANGLEVVEEARRWSPETRVLVLTGLTSPGLLARARDSGAHGLFLKSDPVEELSRALEDIVSGKHAFSRSVSAILSGYVQVHATSRERQILYALARGEPNNQIAERLGISPSTVDKHRTSLMRKFGARSLGELLAAALREGLLDIARHT